MAGKKRYVDMYEGAWRPDDMDGMDARISADEEAEELSGMRIFDPSWTDEFIEYISSLYYEAIGVGMTEEEALEDVAAQEGYTPEVVQAILEEGSARLQDSMPEE
ncbi:MAG: hypothetical protein IKK43_06855 [Clostridia bacterium]|nr:hypothetical protein [Clostridia bacterium]